MMIELYWITRLSTIKGMFIGLLILSLIVICISTICYFINFNGEYEFEKKCKAVSKSIIKKLIIPLIIGILGTVFVPTTKEALAIWGIGGTIDYIKSNPTAKQLPDKCVKALDKWVDSWTEEKKDSVAHK